MKFINRKHHGAVAALLLLAVIGMTVLAPLGHAHPGCPGEGCHLCATLKRLADLMELLLLIGGAAVCLCECGGKVFVTDARHRPRLALTLIRLKVKLTD